MKMLMDQFEDQLAGVVDEPSSDSYQDPTSETPPEDETEPEDELV
jgi:hypothetical protein